MGYYKMMMNLIQDYPLLGLCLFLLIIGVTLWVVFKIQKFFRYLRMGRLRSQGVTGESRAKEILEELGFTIVADNAVSQHEFYVDGQVVHFSIRPDLQVQLGEENWIVEVKNGVDSGINNRLTRRQLLEYSVQFPDHQIALLDVQQEKLMRVEFD